VAVEVSTPVFEGPFDLLLHLILKEQVDIHEVPLARIVDRYVEEVGRLEHIDLQATTEFLLIAATLVELKTRRLLPGRDDLDLDDDLAVLDQRDALLARLLEFKTFQDVATTLRRLWDGAVGSVPRRAGPEEPFASLVPDPLSRISPEQLRAAAIRGLSPPPRPKAPDLDDIVPVRVTIKEAVDDVLAGLPRHGTVTFRQLTAGVADRMVVVVRFLAVLELYKQGVIDVHQAERFGDITLRRLADGDAAVAAAGWSSADDDDLAAPRPPRADDLDLRDLDRYDDELDDDLDDDLPAVVEIDLDDHERETAPARAAHRDRELDDALDGAADHATDDDVIDLDADHLHEVPLR
jgi:segregation and condensation protein A